MNQPSKSINIGANCTCGRPAEVRRLPALYAAVRRCRFFSLRHEKIVSVVFSLLQLFNLSSIPEQKTKSVTVRLRHFEKGKRGVSKVWLGKICKCALVHIPIKVPVFVPPTGSRCYLKCLISIHKDPYSGLTRGSCCSAAKRISTLLYSKTRALLLRMPELQVYPRPDRLICSS